MAGHSKWANIRHRKGAQDAKRSKEFAKLAKNITVAAMNGIPDPDSNPSLRLAIVKARAKSMPKKNIDAAVTKASGTKDGANFQELSYAANVAGVSFLINCLTDNVNRASSEIQFIISKAGGSIAGASSVSYIFDRKGVLEFPAEELDEETVMMQALDAGAQDFEADEGIFYVYTNPSDFSSVKEKLEQEGLKDFKTAEVKYIPNQEIKLPKEKAEKILNFIDALEDNEDVQDVFHNLDAASLD